MVAQGSDQGEGLAAAGRTLPRNDVDKRAEPRGPPDQEPAVETIAAHRGAYGFKASSPPRGYNAKGLEPAARRSVSVDESGTLTTCRLQSVGFP